MNVRGFLSASGGRWKKIQCVLESGALEYGDKVFNREILWNLKQCAQRVCGHCQGQALGGVVCAAYANTAGRGSHAC